MRWAISKNSVGLILLLVLAGCSGPEPPRQAGALDLLPLAGVVDAGDAGPVWVQLSVDRGSALLGRGWVDSAGRERVNAEPHAGLHLPFCPGGGGTVQVRLALRDPRPEDKRNGHGVIVIFNGRKLKRLSLDRDRLDHVIDLEADWFRRGTNELQLTGETGGIALGGAQLRFTGTVGWFTADHTTRRALVSGVPLELDLPRPLPDDAVLHVSLAAAPRLLPWSCRPVHYRLEWCRLTGGPDGAWVPDGEWGLLFEERAMPEALEGLGEGGHGWWRDRALPLDLPSDAPLRLRMSAVGRAGTSVGIFHAWGPLMLSWPGPAPVAATEPLNLILVLADTLRADRLGAYGTDRRLTPHLDRLAAGSVQFGDTLAQAPSTIPSVSSFFTGRYFNRVSAWVDRHDLPAAIPLFAEALSGAGCRTLAVVANPLMLPETGFARGFDEYHHLQGIPREFHGRRKLPVHRPAADVSKRFFERLDVLSRERFFAYLHYMDPHDPYPAEGDPRFAGGRLAGQPWEGWLGPATGEILAFGDSSIAAADREMVIRSYDEGVRRFDRQMGLLLAELRRRGVLDTTVVAVIADHGEELFERGLVGHGHTVHEELLRVPALIRFPGRPGDPRPTLVFRRVQLLDVAATLLDLMDAGPPEGHAGTSQLPLVATGDPGAGDGERFFETRYRAWVEPPLNDFLAGVEQDGWKLVRDRRGGGDRLFHLDSDPGETENLARLRPEQARALGQRLDSWLAAQEPLDPEGGHDPGSSGDVAARQVEALQALGYMQ